MKLISTLALATALTAGLAQAQACSSLTVTGSGAPGSDLDFALTGAGANAFALAAIGETAGSTSIQFGALATLDLGLDRPFFVLPLGRTDTNGDVTQTFTVPNVPSMQNLNAQAFTADISFMPPTIGLTFCTSDVVAFTIG